ncbi:hypothetical protein MKX01_021804, partial [Papaver californicum]
MFLFSLSSRQQYQDFVRRFSSLPTFSIFYQLCGMNGGREILRRGYIPQYFSSPMGGYDGVGDSERSHPPPRRGYGGAGGGGGGLGVMDMVEGRNRIMEVIGLKHSYELQ